MRCDIILRFVPLATARSKRMCFVGRCRWLFIIVDIVGDGSGVKAVIVGTITTLEFEIFVIVVIIGRSVAAHSFHVSHREVIAMPYSAFVSFCAHLGRPRFIIQ